MKCTNNLRKQRLLCLLTAGALLLGSCSPFSTAESLPANAYDAYSYRDSYLYKTEEGISMGNYFSKDLCVTNSINFGTDETDSKVAQAAGGFNLSRQEVVYSQNIFERMYPASTTKILTAYIILRDCNLNEVVTVSETAAKQPSDASVCNLKKGDNITVGDLLYGLMLMSGNDAAEALAEHHSGTIEAFAEEMNQTAASLGATKSHFVNPSGYPNENHYTTVYDMYLISRAAYENPKFMEIVGAKKKAVSYTSSAGKTIEKTYSNNNRYFTGAAKTPQGFEILGGKTGTTGAAGYCLVLFSKNASDEEIISIVFKADGRYNLYLLMNQILSRFAK